LDTPTPASHYSNFTQAVLSTANDSRVVSNLADCGNNLPSSLTCYDGLT
jgi:hypothetical protein